MSNAYYTLVQYMPDAGRKEAVNVGLIVLREEPNYFFKARMTTTDPRAKLLDPNVDQVWLDTIKAATYNRLERYNREAPLTFAIVDEYRRTRGNSIVLTELRSCVLGDDPFASFEELYKELVTA